MQSNQMHDQPYTVSYWGVSSTESLSHALYWKLVQASPIEQAGMSSDWTSRPSMYSKHLNNIQPLLLETYYKHQKYII